MTRKFIILLLFTISFSSFATDTLVSVTERKNIQRRARSMRNLATNNGFAIPARIDNEALSKEQQLIFGLVAINGRGNALGNDGYAYYLRELLSVTGYSIDEAKAIMEQFNNNPQKYLSVLEKIKQNLVVNNE